MTGTRSDALPFRRLSWAGSIALLLAVRLAVFSIWRPDYTNPTIARVLTAFFLATALAWLWLVYQVWLLARGTSGDAFMRWAFIAAVVSIVGPNVWPWAFGGQNPAAAILMWLSTLATVAVPFLLAFGGRARLDGRLVSITALVWGVALFVPAAIAIFMPLGGTTVSHVFGYVGTATNVVFLVALAMSLFAERRRVEQARQP